MPQGYLLPGYRVGRLVCGKGEPRPRLSIPWVEERKLRLERGQGDIIYRVEGQREKRSMGRNFLRRAQCSSPISKLTTEQRSVRKLQRPEKK